MICYILPDFVTCCVPGKAILGTFPSACVPEKAISGTFIWQKKPTLSFPRFYYLSLVTDGFLQCCKGAVVEIVEIRQGDAHFLC